ncbi:casein kinase ii subunit beta [Anaeramoeba flamelloides]|uniref:Casein kinase II subunit beta n=1 Tax=Anaeramoeba flamelloides TaxID=1746091 RepID=A0AAV7Y7E4_9EUKA|nr:casein kinase ii subunit beta [Anaeramoeba flamelloides]
MTNSLEKKLEAFSISNLEDLFTETYSEWFCSLKGNEFFCKINPTYLKNEESFEFLKPQFKFFDLALEIITNQENKVLEKRSNEDNEIIEKESQLLYGLIHSSYILTDEGMEKMKEKFLNGDFGECPRLLCKNSVVLPIEFQNDISQCVKLYCPICKRVFYPPYKYMKMIGAYFGSQFPHLFLKKYPEFEKKQEMEKYQPTMFGFDIHEESELYYKPQKKSKKDDDKN